MKTLNQYIELFGLSKEFTHEELKEAYHDLAHVWHPDKHGHSDRLQEKATKQFQEIREGYVFLKEALKKDMHFESYCADESNSQHSGKETWTRTPRGEAKASDEEVRNERGAKAREYNTSGQGKDSILPEGIKGWSWGGFIVSPVWSISNRTWVGLLSCIPYLGCIMTVILGVKGREWAWRNKKWESVEHFQRVQKNWSIFGLIILSIGVIGVIAAIILPQMENTIKQDRAYVASQAPDSPQSLAKAHRIDDNNAMSQGYSGDDIRALAKKHGIDYNTAMSQGYSDDDIRTYAKTQEAKARGIAEQNAERARAEQNGAYSASQAPALLKKTTSQFIMCQNSVGHTIFVPNDNCPRNYYFSENSEFNISKKVISVDFFKINIHQLISMISEATGINIFLIENLPGSVTVTRDSITFTELFREILLQNNLYAENRAGEIYVGDIKSTSKIYIDNSNIDFTKINNATCDIYLKNGNSHQQYKITQRDHQSITIYKPFDVGGIEMHFPYTAIDSIRDCWR